MIAASPPDGRRSLAPPAHILFIFLREAEPRAWIPNGLFGKASLTARKAA